MPRFPFFLLCRKQNSEMPFFPFFFFSGTFLPVQGWSPRCARRPPLYFRACATFPLFFFSGMYIYFLTCTGVVSSLRSSTTPVLAGVCHFSLFFVCSGTHFSLLYCRASITYACSKTRKNI